MWSVRLMLSISIWLVESRPLQTRPERWGRFLSLLLSDGFLLVYDVQSSLYQVPETVAHVDRASRQKSRHAQPQRPRTSGDASRFKDSSFPGYPPEMWPRRECCCNVLVAHCNHQIKAKCKNKIYEVRVQCTCTCVHTSVDFHVRNAFCQIYINFVMFWSFIAGCVASASRQRVT